MRIAESQAGTWGRVRACAVAAALRATAGVGRFTARDRATHGHAHATAEEGTHHGDFCYRAGFRLCIRNRKNDWSNSDLKNVTYSLFLSRKSLKNLQNSKFRHLALFSICSALLRPPQHPTNLATPSFKQAKRPSTPKEICLLQPWPSPPHSSQSLPHRYPHFAPPWAGMRRRRQPPSHTLNSCSRCLTHSAGYRCARRLPTTR